jgi:hypothetical protein
VLFRITSLYWTRGEYQRAVDNVLAELERALSHSRKDSIVSAAAAANSICLQLFTNISWDPKTGERRSDDPRGFADEYGLGIGKPFKYGMTNAEEDSATFATVFVTQELFAAYKGQTKTDPAFLEHSGYGSWEQLEKNLDIETYVRAQLADNIFEAPAKYLYEKYLRYGFVVTPESNFHCPIITKGDVTFAEVKDSLARTPASKVDANTRRMIEILESLYNWLGTHCVR